MNVPVLVFKHNNVGRRVQHGGTSEVLVLHGLSFAWMAVKHRTLRKRAVHANLSRVLDFCLIRLQTSLECASHGEPPTRLFSMDAERGCNEWWGVAGRCDEVWRMCSSLM